MKKIDFTGWKDIFYFAFTQTIKSKSFKVSIIILSVLMFVSFPVLGFMNKESSVSTLSNDDAAFLVEPEDAFNDICLYYHYDKSDKELDEFIKGLKEELLYEQAYADDETFEKILKSIDSSKKTVVVSITKEDDCYNSEIFTGYNIMKTEMDVEIISSVVSNGLDNIQKSKITGIQNDASYDEIYTSVYYDDNEEKTEIPENIDLTSYMISMFFVILLLFVISFSGESIATSVVMEKAGRMIEYLMITVKPMAVILGKIVAVFVTVLIEMAAMTVSAILSNIICKEVFNMEVIGDIMSGYSNNLLVHPLRIILIILFFIGGFLLFAMFAAVAGATVSRVEELSEAMVLYSVSMIIGAYMAIAYFVKIMLQGTVNAVSSVSDAICCFFPLSSPFCVPIQLITGNISCAIAAESLAVLFVSVFLIFVLASKIYEYMLFYNGAKLKINDIIYIAKHGRREE